MRRILAQHAEATVVQVADAKNLRRALLLTLQVAELGHPMVLVLNMLDELEERAGDFILEVPPMRRDFGAVYLLDAASGRACSPWPELALCAVTAWRSSASSRAPRSSSSNAGPPWF